MPYRLSDDGLCVQQKKDGRWITLRCYDNHTDALAYLGALEAKVNETLQEAGGSLDDKVYRVRQAFHAWNNEGLSWDRMAWVLDVFETHVMVMENEKVYRVDYAIDAEEAITFSEKPWPVYVLRYIPAEEASSEDMTEDVAAEESTAPVREAVSLTVRLAEAAQDRDGFYPNSVIVLEGESLNGNIYTLDALKSGMAIFDGAKLVADHEIEEGQNARPEGSIHDVLGKVTNPHLGKTAEGQNALLGDVFISESETKIRTKVKEGILGDISIKAWGSGMYTREGKFMVEAFEHHPYTNVALVTVGAAGGRLVSESQHEPDPPAEAREASPDTVTDSDQPVTEAPRREVRSLREADTVTAELAEVITERDHLLEENTRLFRDLRTMQAETQIAAAVSGTGDLPQPTLARIADRAAALKEVFATHGSAQTVEQFREAVEALVEAERAYLAQITPNGAVTGLTLPGGSVPVEDILAEAFRDIVPPEQVAVAVRGRE